MKLLCDLYKIHSMSGQENAMRKFIKGYVKKMEGVSCTQKDGNLYIVKGKSETYPCVVAHLDQVQTKHSPDFRVFTMDGKLFGFSGENARQEGLGADDKNGIWVALKCLERYDAIKVALFKEEETGCRGSAVADMNFFKDVRFVLQADRKNGGDLITEIGGSLCSREFIEDISGLIEKHGYKETYGLMTDVDTLSENGLGVSCVNISCGYYNPHTDQEYTIIDELKNCLAFVMGIIDTCTKVYPHEREDYFSSKYPSYSRDWGWYDNVPSDNVWVPDFKDYSCADDAIYEFLEYNIDLTDTIYQLYNLWDYISSDAETYGVSYEHYCDIADEMWMYACDYYLSETEK